MNPFMSIDHEIKHLRAVRKKYGREFISQSKFMAGFVLMSKMIDKALGIISKFPEKEEPKGETSKNKRAFPFLKAAVLTGGFSFLAGALYGRFRGE